MHRSVFNRFLGVFIIVSGLVTSFVHAEDVFDPFKRLDNEGSKQDDPNSVSKDDFRNIDRDEGPAIPEIQFQSDPITMAFQMISDVSGWSIFSTSTVDKAKITLWAKNISSRELLDKVVALSGFTYHQKGNVISVMTYDEYLQNYGLVRKIIPLKYADSDSVSKIVDKLLSKLGKIVVHKKTNTIVLFEAKANLKYILEVIDHLDSPGEETVSEIIKLKNLSSDSIAKTLQEIFVGKVSKEKNKPDVKLENTNKTKKTVSKSDNDRVVISGNEIGIYSAPESNLLIIVGTRRDINEAKKVIALLDVAKEESLTEIVELKYNNAKLVAGVLEKIFTRKNTNSNNKSSKVIKTAPEHEIGFYAVPNSNRLIITGLKDKIEEAKSLIDEIDIDNEMPPIEIIGLKYTDAKLMADTLKELFSSIGEGGKKNPENGMDSKIGFHVILETNRLIVVGSEKNIAEVKVLIDKIDISIEMSVIEIIEVQYTDAEQMAKILKEIFSPDNNDSRQELGYGQDYLGGAGLNPFRLSMNPIGSGQKLMVSEADRANSIGTSPLLPEVNSIGSNVNKIGIHVIPDSNRLIVVGTTQSIDQVKDLIAKIDISTEMSLIEIIELKYTDVKLMADTLKEIFSSKDNGSTKNQVDGKREEIGLYVIPDSNRMIVAGTQKDIDEVKELIARIDISTEMSLIKIIELKYTDAKLVANTLKEIFSSKDMDTVNNQNDGKREEIGLYVIPDSNRIIVAGTQKDIDEVRELIARIDISTEMSLIEIIDLEHKDPELMVSTLKNVFSFKKVDDTNGKTQVEEIGLCAVPFSKRIIVAGVQKDIERVKKLVSEIDVDNEMSLTEIIELKYTDVVQMADILGKIFSSKNKKSGESQTYEIGLYAVTESNRLIIAGMQEDIDEAKKLISEVDVDSEVSLLEIVKLEYADAEFLVNSLREIFSDNDEKKTSKKAGKPKLKSKGAESGDFIAEFSESLDFFAIGRTNSVVVKGLKRDVERVLEFIKKLDVYADSITKSYHIAFVNASDVIVSLQQVLGISGNTNSNTSVVITILEENNSILLTGPPSAHRITETVIESIDVQGEYEAGIIKMYKLDNSDAVEVAAVIKELIGQDEVEGDDTKKSKFLDGQDLEGSQLGGDGLSKLKEYTNRIETRVTTNVGTNSIIIQATANRQRELAKLIEVLDARKKQVMIKAMIVEVVTTDDLEVGVEVNNASKDIISFSSFGLSEIDPVTGSRDVVVSPGGTVALLRPDKVQAIVRAIKSDSNMKIKSSPEILVNDNAAGVISSLSMEPTKVTSQGETSTTTGFGGYAEAGTEFTITPHISERNYLRVVYEISLDSFGAKTDPDLPPSKNTNNIKSEATVPDGATIVVGGLQVTSEVESVSKVPLLGDIPILGLVFQSTSIKKLYRTTYLFITPIIMQSKNFDDLKKTSVKELGEIDKAFKGTKEGISKPNSPR